MSSDLLLFFGSSVIRVLKEDAARPDNEWLTALQVPFCFRVSTSHTLVGEVLGAVHYELELVGHALTEQLQPSMTAWNMVQ